jgi:hypothetical protein
MKLDQRQIEVMDDIQAEILKKKTPAERIRIGASFWTSAFGMLTAHLRSIHPEWSEETVRREVARRLSHGAV